MAVDIGTIKITDNSALVKAASQQQIKKGLTNIAIAWDKNVVRNIPVDTGYLRNSRGYNVDDKSVTVGFKAEYAPYVELGTWKQRAQPYLEPSINNYKDEYKRIMETALKK